MDSIIMKLPPNREDDLRIVRFWGQRRLHDFADTGVFTISSRVPEAETKPSAPAFDEEDTLSATTIEIDCPLEVAASDRGNDPYNRGNYSRRTSSV